MYTSIYKRMYFLLPNKSGYIVSKNMIGESKIPPKHVSDIIRTSKRLQWSRISATRLKDRLQHKVVIIPHFPIP